MKIITWNVNGLRAVERKEALGPFLENHQPDILCLQETKSKPEQVIKLDETYPHHTKFYHSAEKPGYAGVSIWLSERFKSGISNIEFITGMPNNPVDNEGRIGRIDFDLDGQAYSILNIYFPNGGKSDQAWKGKLVFYDCFLEYVNQLRDEGRQVVWCGDINCAHTEIDLARPKNNDGKIGFHPKERAWLDRVIANNWIDVWRQTNPDTVDVYSYWHTITRSRLTNVGWRIDYFFVDKNFIPAVKNIGYLTDQMGSDHCPAMLEV